MRKALIVGVLGAVLVAFGFGSSRAQFVDVPPCHWAVESITRITDSKEVAPPTSTPQLAENALTQVFEGLKCGNAGWASQFVDAAPAAFADVANGKTLQGFSLKALETKVKGNQATIKYALSVAYTQGGSAVKKSVQSTARLKTKAGVGWAVEYASLSALNLPLFPR